jgi:carboxypeptidase C (cathepsin A)
MEFAQDFYGVLGDIAATREFIRTYRTRFDAWDQPVYLAGESYGVWRAAGTAEAMQRAGEKVEGVILISGGIPMGPVVNDDMRAALFIPTRTASAFHHRKLRRTQAVPVARGGAVGRTVRPALAANRRGDERSAIVAHLARFTGLDARLIDRDTLVVDRSSDGQPARTGAGHWAG